MLSAILGLAAPAIFKEAEVVKANSSDNKSVLAIVNVAVVVAIINQSLYILLLLPRLALSPLQC